MEGVPLYAQLCIYASNITTNADQTPDSISSMQAKTTATPAKEEQHSFLRSRHTIYNPFPLLLFLWSSVFHPRLSLSLVFPLHLVQPFLEIISPGSVSLLHILQRAQMLVTAPDIEMGGDRIASPTGHAEV